ncbi:hypothetical protein [Salinibaculum rarum]|uniref:hypothetical protein n=1 Tax=Salinibaculum rarum TaxID=3058903 RepID=UPI0026603AF2|nr:hypothetical protein [Salinibaculum sp. KK48]
MPVPGYDPDDVDNLLETKLEETDVQSHLSDDEWQSYQDDSTSLVDLLDEEQIDQLLDET